MSISGSATSRSASATSSRSTTSRSRSTAGSLTALLGPSGSGKSTLLRVIAGLEQPDAGEVLIGGEDVTGRAAAGARRRLRLPALRGLQAHDRVRQHRVRAEDPQAARAPRSRSASTSCSSSCSSQGFGERYPAQLSGGQRQRMGLARALAVDPEVLLLDEPFGALDARVRTELRVWLRRLHDETHTTTVIVTHDQEEAMEVADQVVVMNKRPGRAGRRARASSTTQPANEFVMSFVGQVNRFGDAWVRPHDLEIVARAERLDARGDGRAGRPPRLRGARRARARRRRARSRCS